MFFDIVRYFRGGLGLSPLSFGFHIITLERLNVN
jgi:hypothetical protein